jgi:predicted RNA-binding Zn-ribbon protein involved in translation (DUF1610 family)
MTKSNYKWGNDIFGRRLRIQTEVVNGVCPTCQHQGILVSLFKKHYRCVTCGSDLEQKGNGSWLGNKGKEKKRVQNIEYLNTERGFLVAKFNDSKRSSIAKKKKGIIIDFDIAL